MSRALWTSWATSAYSRGGRIRTTDLRVMSPTSYHCSTPHHLLNLFLKAQASYQTAHLLSTVEVIATPMRDTFVQQYNDMHIYNPAPYHQTWLLLCNLTHNAFLSCSSNDIIIKIMRHWYQLPDESSHRLYRGFHPAIVGYVPSVSGIASWHNQ